MSAGVWSRIRLAGIGAVLAMSPILGGAGMARAGAPHQSHALSEVEEAAIKIACEDLSKQYAHDLDGKDYAALSTLFAADGVWQVLGNRMVGPAQVARYWKERTDAWAPGHGRVHQMANQVVTVIDRDHAIGRSMVIIYFFNTQVTEKQSLSPTLIARNEDEYVRTAAGWKFRQRKISTVAMADPAH